jgi:hypothetical protein
MNIPRPNAIADAKARRLTLSLARLGNGLPRAVFLDVGHDILV